MDMGNILSQFYVKFHRNILTNSPSLSVLSLTCIDKATEKDKRIVELEARLAAQKYGNLNKR